MTISIALTENTCKKSQFLRLTWAIASAQHLRSVNMCRHQRAQFRNATEPEGRAYGSYSLHLGPAPFRLDSAGRITAAKPAFRGRYVGSAGRPVRRPAERDERAQRVFDIHRRRQASAHPAWVVRQLLCRLPRGGDL